MIDAHQHPQQHTEGTTLNPRDLLTAAHHWHNAGYCVVPSRDDGSKRPFGKWKEYQHNRPTWQQIEEWLTTGRYTGIGVITGKVSDNVEMIELEGPISAARDALTKIGAHVHELASRPGGQFIHELWNIVATGCVEQSGGGGLHLFVRVSDGDIPGNSKLATDQAGKVLAETRGEGGFVIVAPTPGRTGHEPTAAYTLIGDAHPDHTPTITREDLEAVHWIITEALHDPNAPQTPPASTPTQEPREKPATTATGPLTPWDDYAQQTTWADILTPLGWTPQYTAPDGRTHWTRPGKNPEEGTSATTLEDGPLYVFSTSTDLPDGVGMSKQHVYAHLHHGGDHTQAARALAQQGFGEPVPRHEIQPWIPPDTDPTTLTPTELAEAEATWVREKLPLLDWAALWADETEEEWIVEPILAKRRLVALYSAPKVGKSLLMLEIAASIAAGRAVLGNNPAPPIRTLYVDFENDPRGDIRERLQAMDFTPDDLSNLAYMSYPNIAKFDTKAGAEQLMAAVREYRCEVVIIDTVSRSVQGDENENDTWLAFYRHTGLELKRAEVAMIRLDHSGKDERKGQRGGSAKSGDVDAVWQLKRISDNGYRLICEANRFPISEHHVDLERVTEPHLRHKRDMSARRTAIDEMCGKYAEAGVPDDGSVGVRAAAKILKEAGIAFTSAANNSAALAEYCTQTRVWTMPEMTETTAS